MLDFRPQRARSAISRWAREWTRFHRRRNSKHWSANCTYASPIHTGRATCAVARCSTHARALARSPIPHRCIFTRSPARRPHKSPPNPPLSHRAADAQSAARRARARLQASTRQHPISARSRGVETKNGRGLARNEPPPETLSCALLRAEPFILPQHLSVPHRRRRLVPRVTK